MKNKLKTALFLILTTTAFYAQVVNTGIMHVNPNTIVSIVPDFDNKTTGSLHNDGEAYIYANFNNDGIVTFSAAQSGYTRFQGFLNQKLSGSNQSYFQHLLFDNGNPQPAFSLYSKISVAGNADFMKGIVKDDDFGGLMIFEKAATHTNVDDDSHVDGYVQKNGDDAFQFPIGDGGQFRYAAISAPDLLSDAFTGKYFWENSDLLYPHSNKAEVISIIDNKEYWTIDKTAGASTIFLTLTWDEDTTPSNIYAAPYEDIHIVRWDAILNSWIDEGGVADSSTKEVTTIVNPVSGYGVFTLARIKSDMNLPCGGKPLVVYNAITPDGDGNNDYFILDGLENCPNNSVEIYNRWGVKVYETASYNTTGNVFKGFSQGRTTIDENVKLPRGTYFYIISFLNETGDIKTKKAGYLYLNDY